MNSTKVLGTLTGADLENLATRTIDESDDLSVQNIMGDFFVRPAQKKTDHEMMLDVNNLFPKSWQTSLSECEDADYKTYHILATPKSIEAFDAGYKSRYETELRKRYPQITIKPMAWDRGPMTENNFSMTKNEHETVPSSSCFSCFPICCLLDLTRPWNEYMRSLYT